MKKRRKGVFGPPFGYKCTIFIDDLNMPVYDLYGS
jgi:dynein heavy chain